MAALASPVRWQIADALATHGPSSIREIAARLGRSAAGLYYHVNALVEVGVVVLVGARPTERRAEAVYRLVAPRLVVDRQQRSSAYTEALLRTCGAMLRLTERNHRAAVQAGAFVLEGPQRTLAVRRLTGKLNRERLRRVNRLLDELAGLFGEPDAKGEGCALTVVLTPLVDREG